MSYIFTSESVSEGHPDKVCDQISDAILDAYLKEAPDSRVACETLIKNNIVVVAGEITSKGNPNLEPVIRNTINSIGYDNDDLGFNGSNCEIQNHIFQQSPDIAQGVNEGEGENLEQGAGDQGLMFGYACKENEALMPAPIDLSHQLVKKQSELRKNGGLDWLRPDAKSQVTFVYENDRPEKIDTVVLSTQHSKDVKLSDVKDFVMEEIIKTTIPENLLSSTTKIHINPTGNFVIGGPNGDCGLTGRKIIVDTYGGMARHGGGAFSGKDPSKVDRSAAYMARYIAKNIVATKLADKCEIQLSYAIGVAEPTSISVDTFRTSKIENSKISSAVSKVFNLTPKGIIDTLDLLNVKYQPTAAFGHFGRDDKNFTWEQKDKVDILMNELG